MNIKEVVKEVHWSTKLGMRLDEVENESVVVLVVLNLPW